MILDCRTEYVYRVFCLCECGHLEISTFPTYEQAKCTRCPICAPRFVATTCRLHIEQLDKRLIAMA